MGTVMPEMGLVLRSGMLSLGHMGPVGSIG